MDRTEEKLMKACLLILTGIAVTGSLIFLKPVLMSFVVSVFLYFIMIPGIDYFRIKFKLPKMLGLLFTLLLTGSFTVILILLALSSFENFLHDTKIYQEKISDLFIRFGSFLQNYQIDLSSELQKLQGNFRELPIFNWMKSMTKQFLSFTGQSFLVVIYLMFLVSGHHPGGTKSQIRSEIEAGVQKYILTKVISSAVTAILVGICLKLAGLDLAFMFAIITFLLNFIPSIGSMIAVILPLPVAFIQFEFSAPFYFVLIVPGFIQFVIGNVIEPRVMGEGLGLHPVTVLFSLMFWGMIWGTPGMFLAVPLTACFRIVCNQIPVMKPIARLMAGESDF